MLDGHLDLPYRMCRRPVEAAVDLVLELDLRPVNFAGLAGLEYVFKGLREVGLDIPDLLDPNRQPDHVRCDANFSPVLRVEVFVRGGSGVEDEGLGVAEAVQ